MLSSLSVVLAIYYLLVGVFSLLLVLSFKVEKLKSLNKLKDVFFEFLSYKNLSDQGWFYTLIGITSLAFILAGGLLFTSSIIFTGLALAVSAFDTYLSLTVYREKNTLFTSFGIGRLLWHAGVGVAVLIGLVARIFGG
jgi:hypothetical protein